MHLPTAYLRQVKRAAALAAVLGGGRNMLLLGVALLAIVSLEAITAAGSVDTLIMAAGVASVLLVAAAVIQLARRAILLRAALWLEHGLGRHLLEVGLAERRSPDTMQDDQSAVATLSNFVAGRHCLALADAPWTPSALLAVTALKPMLGAVLAVAMALLLLLGALVRRSPAVPVVSHSSWAALSERFDASRDDPAIVAECWADAGCEQLGRRYRSGVLSAQMAAAVSVLKLGAQLALVFIGGVLVVRGSMSIGAVAATFLLSQIALGPLSASVLAIPALQAFTEAWRRTQGKDADQRHQPSLADVPARSRYEHHHAGEAAHA